MPSVEHEAMVREIIERGQRTPEEPPTAEMLRQTREGELAGLPPTPPDMTVEDATIGGVCCVVVTPTEAPPVGTIVFLHGGGYIWMRAQTHLPVSFALARAPSSAASRTGTIQRRWARAATSGTMPPVAA